MKNFSERFSEFSFYLRGVNERIMLRQLVLDEIDRFMKEPNVAIVSNAALQRRGGNESEVEPKNE